MRLKEIYCQDRAIESLMRAYGSGKMAHAYIFAGPEGVGRRAAATVWAKMLLCQDRVEVKNKDGRVFFDSCGECVSCRLFEGGGHPDFRFIYKELIKLTREGGDRTTPVEMPIDVIREFLTEKIANRPSMSEWVVYVIEEAEKLNKASQNSLLKVLEEPPGYCVIILLCTRLDKMLPTTQSRCQVLRFGPIEEEYIVRRLGEEGIDKEQAVYWSRFCEGSLGLALEWSGVVVEDDKKQLSGYEMKRRLVQRLIEYSLSDTESFADWLVSMSRQTGEAWLSQDKDRSKTDLNRKAQKGLIRMVISALSDAMRLAATGGDAVIVNGDQRGCIEAIAARFEAGNSAIKVHKACETLLWVDRSVNEKMIFEELLLNYGDCGTMGSIV